MSDSKTANEMTQERFDAIKQSPRQASVTDIEDLCDEIERLRAGSPNVPRGLGQLCRCCQQPIRRADEECWEALFTVAARPDDNAELGLVWFNGLTAKERTQWLKAAGTNAAIEAWRLFRSGGTIRAE